MTPRTAGASPNDRSRKRLRRADDTPALGLVGPRDGDGHEAREQECDPAREHRGAHIQGDLGRNQADDGQSDARSHEGRRATAAQHPLGRAASRRRSAARRRQGRRSRRRRCCRRGRDRGRKRQEGQETGHAPPAGEDEDAREDGRGVEQSAVRRPRLTLLLRQHHRRRLRHEPARGKARSPSDRRPRARPP